MLIARQFAALGDPLRIKMVHALFAGPMSVNAIAQATGGLQSNVSRHLNKLTAAGVLDRDKKGSQVFYSIADPSIYDLCEQVCGALEKRLAKQAEVIGAAVRR